jgi:hypothetical protein
MSEQFICDECGEPIDLTKPHYQLTGAKVQATAGGIAGGALTAVDSPVTLHYHEEHLPVYKIAGEEIDTLPSTPVESPPAPTGD